MKEPDQSSEENPRETFRNLLERLQREGLCLGVITASEYADYSLTPEGETMFRHLRIVHDRLPGLSANEIVFLFFMAGSHPSLGDVGS